MTNEPFIIHMPPMSYEDYMRLSKDIAACRDMWIAAERVRLAGLVRAQRDAYMARNGRNRTTEVAEAAFDVILALLESEA